MNRAPVGDCGALRGVEMQAELAAPPQHADHMFAALADGSQVRMPLAKTFWSPRFGMVADSFGVGWMVTTAP